MSLSLLAIELADCHNNENLLGKSVFIKIKAVVCLGDLVTAFKLAVWCKHLRPNVSTCHKLVVCELLSQPLLDDRYLSIVSLVRKNQGVLE